MEQFTKQERGDGFLVSMTVAKQIIHEADIPRPERYQIFGGDELGHWDVNRALLLAKVLHFEPKQFAIPESERRAMANVSPLDMDYCRKLAEQPITDPLIFVDVSDGSGDDAQMMMIDGHHRAMASVLRKQEKLPVLLFWRDFQPLLRVVRIIETTTYMDPPPLNQALVHQSRVTVEG